MAPLPPLRGVDAPEAVRGLDIGEGDIRPFMCCGDLGLKSGLPMGETGQDIFLGIWISLEKNELISDLHWQCQQPCVCVCERERLKERLKIWNKEQFGDTFKKVKKIEADLKKM